MQLLTFALYISLLNLYNYSKILLLLYKIYYNFDNVLTIFEKFSLSQAANYTWFLGL